MLAEHDDLYFALSSSFGFSREDAHPFSREDAHPRAARGEGGFGFSDSVLKQFVCPHLASGVRAGSGCAGALSLSLPLPLALFAEEDAQEMLNTLSSTPSTVEGVEHL
jgi:hypothetical protein